MFMFIYSTASRALGTSDQSVVFDVVSKSIIYNDCPVKSYPMDKPKGFKVPQNLTMILDMDNGTLGFKVCEFSW